MEDISTRLHAMGDQKQGNEALYQGHTGRPLNARVFIGPTFYQRLKHLVDDKVHSRARGPVAMLTRQPLEGRSRDGGLRMGEMERDCLVTHGCANFMRDRFFCNSDQYRIHICERCGLLAQSNLKKMTCECPNVCGTAIQDLPDSDLPDSKAVPVRMQASVPGDVVYMD